MKKQIFINLPVSDLSRSMQFYENMGFVLNPAYSNETAKCLVWSDEIFLMILTRERFATFTTKPIVDTKVSLSSIYALSVDSLERLHHIAESAIRAGGTEPKPMQDNEAMKLRTIEDFDGHTWEIFFMDTNKFSIKP